ncbi:MAG TPA: AI-2E family transporter, partial [Thermoanaerobaculia bacterium]
MPTYDDDDTDRFDRTLSMRRVPPPRLPTIESAVPSDKRGTTDRRQSNTRILLGTVIVVAVLHLGRPVIVPVALAILFAFLLTPIVGYLERTFLRRTGAIVLSLGLTAVALGFGGWWLYAQFNAVAKELAGTTRNVEEKLRFLRNTAGGGLLEAFERTVQRVVEVREPETADLKVRVLPERKTIAERYEEVAPTAEAVAAIFLVVVVVFFFLRDRESLRDKLLRMAGRAHLTVTTQAIGETSQRISRYLLTIAALNVGFGLLIGLGLWLLRVPHAGLWGVLAGLLRFVPYIGAVLSAAGPTFLAFAVFPNWYTALAVLGLFIFSDQLIGGFIEPIVVGHRVGVSPIALLLAAIFWGWLWGPVGLLLATPITVCLTVG